MIQIVENYERYVDSLPELINNSYYKAEYFMQKLGLKHATYYRKLRLKIFTPSEVKLLTVLLYPEELLMQGLERAEEDIKAGRVIDISEFKEKLRAKYNV